MYNPNPTPNRPSSQATLARFLARRRALMTVDSLPLAMIAAEVAAYWGVKTSEFAFYGRDVADVVAEFDGVTRRDKAMLEWAILDNLNGYCAWTTPTERTTVTAARWSQQRPAYLNPMKYRK